jgi:hypothetical protein
MWWSCGGRECLLVTVKPIEIRYISVSSYGWSGVIPSNNHHNSGAFITRNRRQDD